MNDTGINEYTNECSIERLNLLVSGALNHHTQYSQENLTS